MSGPFEWNGMVIWDLANALGRHPNGEPYWLPYTRIVRAHLYPHFGSPPRPGSRTLRHGEWFTAIQVPEGMPDPLNAGPGDYLLLPGSAPVPAAAREFDPDLENEAAADHQQQQQHQSPSPPPQQQQQQQEEGEADEDDEEGGSEGEQQHGQEQAQEQELPRAPAPEPTRQQPSRAARLIGEARRSAADGASAALSGEEPAADGKAAAPESQPKRVRTKRPCPVEGCNKPGDTRHVMIHTRDCRVQPCAEGNPTFATGGQLARHLLDAHNGGIMGRCQMPGCPDKEVKPRSKPKNHFHHLRLHNHQLGGDDDDDDDDDEEEEEEQDDEEE
ncbi:hypothetical protein BJ166DRAFT_499737 [Pestalotiopsis sp. NC0098]|nr:hypothetical protein BJ166DRAFT_499737 [Pestalotiopsis sp. NC0098]